MTPHFNRDTLINCLFYWENKSPNKEWLIQPIGKAIKTYTWKEASETVRKLANYLISLNFEPKSNIIIVGKNSAEWILADLAIMAAGHISVPVYYTINADNMGYIIEHSEAKLIVVGKLDGKTDSWPDIKQAVPDALPKITLPSAPAVSNSKSMESILNSFSPVAIQDLPLPKPEDLATIIYTSGSTGRSKGVMHDSKNMINAAKYANEIFNINPSDRILSYLPLAHTAERFLVETCSLYHGFHVYFANNLDTFLQDLQRARPTIFFSVPRLWVKFQQGIGDKIPPHVQDMIFKVPVLSGMAKKFILKKLGLNHVRMGATGSAPLAPNVISWYNKLGIEMQEAYAMTENFAYSHLTRPGKPRLGSVGKACHFVECKLTDEGEILVKSPANMLGYYKDAEKTAELFDEDGFLRTGDMGKVDADGYWFITGRVKDLFKTSKGKYISPVPIEQLLGNHPSTESVFVVGDNMNSPLGIVMISEESLAHINSSPEQKQQLTQSFTDLLSEINQKLEGHEKLSKLVLTTERWTIENGLFTPTLKIRRHEIERHYADKVSNWDNISQKIVWA